LTASPLHLYVHIPFCVRKCPYCDFNSHVRATPDWSAHTRALIAELESWRHHPAFSGRRLSTVFFGGGTPSLAPPSLIGNVLESADHLFGLEHDAEITLEANPGASETAHLAGFRQAGVNRLSLGVQSFSDVELAWLERVHNARDAITAYERARAAGFDNINLDLIYGLPNQHPQTWLGHLDRAITLAPEHLSCYQLTVEPHTLLAARHRRHPLPLPDDANALALLHNTRACLTDAGFQAYEISNHARPGYRCRHNDGYWRYHDYIGIGAGAAGKWDARRHTATQDPGAPKGDVIRYANLRSPEAYVAAIFRKGRAVHATETLDTPTAMAEAAWLGLRRTGGVSRPAFRRRFGVDPASCFRHALEPWRKRGCLRISRRAIMLTASGLGLADAIATDLFQLVDSPSNATSEAESKSS